MREEFQRRGWEEVKKKESRVFDFKWTWDASRLKVGQNSIQIVNHFENFSEVGSKTGLLRNLLRLQKDHPDANIYDFFPRCYTLTSRNDGKDDRKRFLLDVERTKLGSMASISNSELGLETTIDTHTQDLLSTLPPLQSIDGTQNIWIVKPGNNARGVGIRVFTNTTLLLEYTETSGVADDYVVQKYIEEPLIVHGKKFDIRQFVLVTGLDPLTVFMLDDCYLRFCSKDYSLDNLEDIYVHLTNHQVQKNSDSYKTSGIAENQWSLSSFKEYLRTDLNQSDAWDTTIRPQIEKILANSMRSWPKTAHRRYSFELLGFDIMLDKNLKPYLLEINSNPGLHMLTEVVRPHHRKAQHDLLKVVMDNRDVWENSNQTYLASEEKFGAWRMIYHEQEASNK